jgi:hypothetical protein
VSAEAQAILDELRALRREVREVAATTEAIREAVLGHRDRIARLEHARLAPSQPPAAAPQIDERW